MRENRRRRARVLLLAAAFAAASGSAMPAPAETPAKTSRISLTSGGRQANGNTPAATVADVSSPAMALDGRSVAFSSEASNLVAGDTNQFPDVFVRTLSRPRTVRVSVTSSGGQANGPSHSPSMSVDGRWVAFVSNATNLVAGDTNGVADIFLHDMWTRRTVRVSVSSAGRQANGESRAPFVSLFGRWITFDSAATNLAAGDTNGRPDAFIRDRTTRTTTRIAPPKVERVEPGVAENAWTARASISYDGRFVAYMRGSTHQVPRIQPGPPPVDIDFGSTPFPDIDAPEPVARYDVYVLDRRTKRSRKVNLAAWDGKYAMSMEDPEISADGRYVVFEAQSVMETDDGLVYNPVDWRDIILYDVTKRLANYVSVNTWGQFGNGHSYDPRVSAQGHAITFASDATNLIAGDSNATTDVFVRDSRDSTTSRVSVPFPAAETLGPSTKPSMSYDARTIVFAYSGRDIEPSDTNGSVDVFLHDRRIDVPNATPLFRSPYCPPPKVPLRRPEACELGPVQRINMTEEKIIRLRATDADRDRVRYGLIAVIPPKQRENPLAQTQSIAADVDPETGIFRWKPAPNHAGTWTFVFWITDQRGASAIAYKSLYVRNPDNSARCMVLRECDRG